MKKKLSISPVLLMLVVMLVVMSFYVFSYFLPAQSKMIALQTDVALAQANAQTYQNYLNNTAPVEQEIAALEDELAQLTNQYVNESNVSFEISKAIQSYQVTLSSVTLDKTTTYKGHSALPIKLSVTGSTENLLQFVSYFETNEMGSYVVREYSMECSAARSEADILLYLCTPSV